MSSVVGLIFVILLASVVWTLAMFVFWVFLAGLALLGVLAVLAKLSGK